MRCGRARAVCAAGVVAAAAASVMVAAGPPAGAQSSPSPVVRFTDSAPTSMEGRGPVRIAVERTDLPVSRALVHYRTQEASATPGVDYVHTAGTLVFEVGARTASFTVQLRDDEAVEETEHLLLHLETSSGSGASTRLTVLDDDLAPSSGSAAAAPATPVTSAPARSAPVAAPSTTAPVVVASSAGVSRPAPATARARVRTVPARPGPRRITLQQTPTTPFELRPSGGASGSTGPSTAVDPLLALGAGLLLARVGAEVWFRARIAAS